MKPIFYQPKALRALRRMPANTSRLIRAKIEQYADNPESLANNVKALQGRDAVRLRVGDWRVIMHDDEVLDVLEVGPRGAVYE